MKAPAPKQTLPPTEGLKTTTTLNNVVRMPWLGLGVFQIDGDAETEKVVRTAIDRGYRSVDTASLYGNEQGVGRAIRSCGVPREHLFVTTKVWNADLFDFALTDSEMAAIAALDRDQRNGADPFNFAF